MTSLHTMTARIKRDPATGFGERLSGLRKAAGITQTALAEEIGVSQRMMAYYESPTAYPPANLLPVIAAALGVSVDALLGVETAKRRAKATDTRMQRRLQQIEKLDATEKRQVLQLIDAFIERGQLKRNVRSNQRTS
jgi:transcriptional regulator with XRE-family HTH domain